jgi:histidine phosphotransferase ChpT
VVNSDRDTVTGQDASGDASPGDGPSPDETGDAAGPGSLGRSPGFRHDGLRLAELLAARLCHEVSDSADTLAGAVEIARTEPGSAAEALAIAAKAAAVLAARLRLLRAAWAGVAEALDVSALRTLCAGLPRHAWVDLDGLPAGYCFPAAAAQVLLNVLLLAAESLPKGGVVIVGEAGPDATLVVPRGQNAAWPRGLATWMADPATPWRAIASAAPHRLQGPLTALVAHAAGARMSFALAADAEAAPPLLLRFA